MFHVEHWVNMRVVIIFIILISIISCNKPNPNPENTDEIYQDFLSQAQSVQKELEVEKKKLEGFKKDLDTATPQTGAIKYAQKKYFESEDKIQKLEQLVKYYELKSASRKQYTKFEYAKAFKAGTPWPTESELTSYKQYKAALRGAKSWDSRRRVEEYEKSVGIVSASAKKPEKKN